MSKFIPNWEQKRIVKDINAWISKWKGRNALGVYMMFKDKNERIVVDVETSDGSLSRIDYWKLYAKVHAHNFEYVTEEEYTECFYEGEG